MKTHAGFNELVDKALDDALADLKSADIRDNPPEAVIVVKESGRALRAEIARKDSARTRRPTRRMAANDPKAPPLPAEFSGIVDHNSALLAVAGAAVSADCDPCLDAVAPELEGIGMSKDDIRAAVQSGRFPGAFPRLTAEMFERACAVAGEDDVDCVEG
jgi:hypothetical protein